jgi:transposase, IS5 family
MSASRELAGDYFDQEQRPLFANGLQVATSAIIDATIINAPSSTKNADQARDPEMHQTKKGNQCKRPAKAALLKTRAAAKLA